MRSLRRSSPCFSSRILTSARSARLPGGGLMGPRVPLATIRPQQSWKSFDLQALWEFPRSALFPGGPGH